MIYHCVYTPNTAETVERNVPGVKTKKRNANEPLKPGVKQGV